MDLHKSALAILLLLALLWPGVASAHSQQTTPTYEELPALLAPVVLLLPWQCNACAEGVSAVDPIQEPEVSWADLGSWINWLAVQLWNRVAYPIICWSLNIAQGVLSALQTAINTVFVAGINGLWRLFLFVLILAWQAIIAGWLKLSDAQLALWAIIGSVQGLGVYLDTLTRFVQDALNLAGEILAQLGELLIALGSLVAYLFGIFFAIIPGIVTAVTTPTTPTEVGNLATNWFFIFFVDTIRGYADSDLGWSWYAIVAFLYAKFGLWVLDELSTANA